MQKAGGILGIQGALEKATIQDNQDP